MQVSDFVLRKLLDDLHEGAYFVSNEGVITYWNKAAERITGYSSEEVIGRSCSDNILIHVDEHGSILCAGGCPLTTCIEDLEMREHLLFLHHKDGHRIPVSVRAAPLNDTDGTSFGAVEVFCDRTPRDEMLRRVEELQEVVMFDRLTHIATRSYADTSLNRFLDEYQRYHTPFSLILLDIDNFKEINKEYGNDAGDSVLRMVAMTLLFNVRSFDVVGRWSGESFIILLRNSDQAAVQRKAEKLRTLIESSIIYESFPKGLSVTVSGGATTVQPNDTVDNLVQRTGEFLHRSKTAGKNRVFFG